MNAQASAQASAQPACQIGLAPSNSRPHPKADTSGRCLKPWIACWYFRLDSSEKWAASACEAEFHTALQTVTRKPKCQHRMRRVVPGC